jgi:hypothetical protein
MPLSPYRVLKTFKYAMYFDGMDDYILLPCIPLAGEVTLTAWFWDINIFTNYWGTVFNWYYDSGNKFLLNHHSYTGYQKWEVHFSGTVATALSSARIPNRWVFATGVYSASQGFSKLYWDTILQGSRTFTAFPQTALTPSSVQVGGYLTGYYFNGYIAHVLLYSRVLSDSDIAWNYQYPDNPIRNGLVLWLQADPAYIKDIDGDGVLEWVDLSGYGNHGKIYGAQLVKLVKTPVRVLKSTRVLASAR